MQAPFFTLHPGHAPLLVSVPHAGTWLPPELLDRYVEHAQGVEDTDWHVARLYDFVRELGASLLVAHTSRYLIVLNRPPQDQPMYPGVNNTELCPTRFFTGEPLYRDGCAPDAAEVQRRLRTVWQPYHDALQSELQRLHARHGHAVLWDAHSIRSQLPWLFDGTLPDLNLGTADGRSCDPGLRRTLAQRLAAQTRFTHVVDGRFKGGYITRHYGRPEQGWHAVQLEMCWSCYMAEAPPYAWDEDRAAGLQPLLRTLAHTLLDWRPGASA